MLDKLRVFEDRYQELESRIADPDLIANQSEWQKEMRAHAQLTPLIEEFRKYKRVMEGIQEAKEILRESSDPEMNEMAKAELVELEPQVEPLENNLKILLLPKDPNDDKDVIVEIRGGAGGDEAALFAGDLFRMYNRYAEDRGWRVELLDSNPTELGGFKEVVFAISGAGAYSRLKFESGVHRVQRIPTTESGGRIHTSTVTVAVLPEVEDVEVNINPNDLRIDTYCASGAGGQHVNRTESAVRIVHLPTGIVVTCQDEKSQLKNKEKAMRVLRAKVLEAAQEAQQAEVAQNRKEQVGTGDRSERIRTYNFPQGRVSDHRITLTLHKLDAILNGELDDLIDPLIAAAQADLLREVES